MILSPGGGFIPAARRSVGNGLPVADVLSVTFRCNMQLTALISSTSCFGVQELIELQVNKQSGPAFHDMGDHQYLCANDKRLGGTCTSGEKVSRANAVCSKCIVSGFPDMQLVFMFSTSPFRIQQLIKLQSFGHEIKFAPDAGVLEVPEGLVYLCHDDYGLDEIVTAVC